MDAAFKDPKALGVAVGQALYDIVGKLNYDAYSIAAGGLTFDGKPMPTWEALGEKVQKRWQTAGGVVCLATMKTVQRYGKD